MSQADDDNHADQLNENNDAYWQSRGYDERPDDWDESEEDQECITYVIIGIVREPLYAALFFISAWLVLDLGWRDSKKSIALIPS